MVGDDSERLLTIARAAKRLGIGKEQLRRAYASGALPGYTIGKRWVRLRSVDVQAWLETRRRPASSGGSDGGAPEGER